MLILVAGLPGSGKTYFAKALCKRMNARSISSDVVRKELQLNGQYNEDIKKKVYDEMLQRTKQYVAEGVDVIIDATFYKAAVRDLYLAVAEEYKTPCFMIQIMAEEETIRRRVEKKREYSEADFEVYQKIKKSFEPINQDHLVLWSDKMNIEEMLENAVREVNLI